MRELVPDEAVAARANARARYLDRFRDGLERIAEACTPKGSSRSPRCCSTDAGPRRAAAGGLVGRGLGGPPHLRPSHRAFEDAEALAEASHWPGPPAVHDLEDAIEDRSSCT